MCWECGSGAKEIYYYNYYWDGQTIIDQWCKECYRALITENED